MKKISISIILLFGIVLMGYTQDHTLKRFRIGLEQNLIGTMLQYKTQIPFHSATSSALIACVEAGYRINDRLLISLRWEEIYRTGKSKNTGLYGGIVNYHLFSGRFAQGYDAGSVSINVQYYLLNSALNTKYKPFVGLGIGRYGQNAFNLALVDPSTNKLTAIYDVDRKFRSGFYPFIGVERNHLYLRFDFNIVASSNSELKEIRTDEFTLQNSNPKVINNYYGLKLGFFLGGGKRKNG